MEIMAKVEMRVNICLRTTCELWNTLETKIFKTNRGILTNCVEVFIQPIGCVVFII